MSEANAREAAAKAAPKAAVKKSATELSPNAEPASAAGTRAISEAEPKTVEQTTYPRNAEETQQAIKESQGKDAKPLKDAGENVQAEAKARRDEVGKKVGEAKEAVQKSVENKRQIPGVSATAAKPLQKLAAKATEVEPKSLATATKKVLQDTADTEQLAGAKDPDMADVRSMAEHLSKGQNNLGDPLSLDTDQVESMKRAFNNKIDALQTKVDAGGNGTALRHLINLKQAWHEDLFDAYEQHGDPVAAQNLRSLSKQYAGITEDQFHGPAKTLFRTQSPEKIVTSLVSGGAKSESALDSLMRNSTTKGAASLRDSIQQEIYKRASKPDGTVDAAKALSGLQKMGDAGKKLFGTKYQELQTLLTDAAKKQAAGEEAPSIFSKSQLDNPERVVQDIASNGAPHQTFVENLMKRLPDEGKSTLRDSVDVEIRRISAADDGNIDGVKARKRFYSMGDTAKSLYGDGIRGAEAILRRAVESNGRKEQGFADGSRRKESCEDRGGNGGS